MKTIMIVFLFAITTSCSHWNWVMKHEQEVREQICTPDTVAETIIKERLVPIIEVDTSLLRRLNNAESQLAAMDDSIKNLNQDSTVRALKLSISKMRGVIANLREMATNTKIREIEKRVPYPVYIDKQNTITQLNKEVILNRRLWIAIGVLSFVAAGLIMILALLIFKKKS